MDHLFGEADELGWVVLKALLLFGTAVIGFRLGERRTLSQLSPFDFVAAVAVGAIVGRVPSAHDASFLTGAATLVSVLFGHWAVTGLRRHPAVSRLIVRPPCLLVSGGVLLPEGLRQSGLTEADASSLLRQQGVADLAEVRFAVLEDRGQLSVIRRAAPVGPDLLRGVAPP